MSIFHTLAFDDSAATNLSDNGNCLSANNPYKPSNDTPIPGTEVDIWSPPAPGTAPLNALSFFNGGPSGGNWNLFAMDDTTGNAGSISGWTLTLDFTPTPPVTPTPTPADPLTAPAPSKCKKKKKKGKKRAATSACKKKKKKK